MICVHFLSNRGWRFASFAPGIPPCNLLCTCVATICSQMSVTAYRYMNHTYMCPS